MPKLRHRQTVLYWIRFHWNLGQIWLSNNVCPLFMPTKSPSILNLNHWIIIFFEIIFRIVWLFLIREHTLKFFETYLTVMSHIVNFDQLFDLFLSNNEVSPKSFKGLYEIRLRDEISIVNIECFENLPQHLICDGVIGWECSCQKFAVIYFAIAVVVHLWDNMFKFILI